MSGITVLWLTGAPDVPPERDGRYRHVLGDPERPAATITRLMAEGPVLAVVRSEEEGRRALALGVDEVVLAEGSTGEAFEAVVARTLARARGRALRDLWLVDMVRKDDTTALGLLASALGRELGEPLKRVVDESRRLSDDVATDAAARTAMADAISESVRSMERAVERMQELVDPRPSDEVVDFADVVANVVRSIEVGAARVARVRLDVDCERCAVALPRWQAVLIVANLVSNALQAIAAQERETGEIVLRLSRQEQSAVLEISDNGIGMDAVVRTYASEPFFSTDRESRLGLGLTLVAARVRRVGGELMIESEPGVGTTVRIFLPLIEADPRPLTFRG